MEFGAEDMLRPGDEQTFEPFFQYASDMGNWLMDTGSWTRRRGLGKGKQPNPSLLGNLEEPGPEVLWPEEETPTFRSIIFFCARYFKSVGGRGGPTGVLDGRITESAEPFKLSRPENQLLPPTTAMCV